MPPTINKVVKDARTWAIVLAVAMTSGIVNMSATRTAAQDVTTDHDVTFDHHVTTDHDVTTTTAGAPDLSVTHATEANARGLLKATSDYMAAQQAFSFDYDSYLEVVTKQNQKIGLASSGTMTMNRPDKMHATRMGGFGNVEFVFDGRTVTMFGKNANAYAQVDATGTTDQLIDVLRNKYHRPVPGADLLMTHLYDQLMPEVVDIKDLGSGVIAGIECDHLAFRTKDVDWQIWIAQGGSPYPCRYSITSTQVPGSPQYTVDLRAWKTGADVLPDHFEFKIPADARRVDAARLSDFDELPGIFSIKKTIKGV